MVNKERRTAWVTMPICGSISTSIEVDADATRADVISAFYDALEQKGPDVKLHPDVEMSWETMERITQGNVFYGEVNVMSIEWDDGDLDDEDSE